MFPSCLMAASSAASAKSSGSWGKIFLISYIPKYVHVQKSLSSLEVKAALYSECPKNSRRVVCSLPRN